MPIGGVDTRYDLPWEEQDKIRRRLELKWRLKEEGVRERYSPFKQMRGEVMTDPAVDRFMDLRKRGRLPNTPFRPSSFYGIMATVLIPIVVMAYIGKWERADYLEGCKNGTIPYKDRKNKLVG